MRAVAPYIVAAAVVASCKGTTKVDRADTVSAVAPAAAPSVGAPVLSAPNDGTDPRRPVLPTADDGFVDKRGGQGWADKCWISINAKRWGWAKAECDQAMAMAPASPQPRASMLYNEGLIARAGGEPDVARTNFLASLALREHPQVRAALDALPPAQAAEQESTGIVDAAPDSDWAGTYEFVENCGRTVGGTGIVVGHTLVVSLTPHGYEADLDSNGWQTQERLHLAASASANEIAFAMDRTRDGDQSSPYKREDSLFHLSLNRGHVLTSWEKYVTTCSDESGKRYFVKKGAESDRAFDGEARPAGKSTRDDAECNYCRRVSPAVKRECRAVCAEKNGGTVTDSCLDLCASVKCTMEYKACPE